MQDLEPKSQCLVTKLLLLDGKVSTSNGFYLLSTEGQAEEFHHAAVLGPSRLLL